MSDRSNSDHHVVSKKYLSEWCRTRGQLLRLDLKNAFERKWMLKSPAGVCYVNGLYGDLENNYFQDLDNKFPKMRDYVLRYCKEKTFGIYKPDKEWLDFFRKYIVAQRFRSESSMDLGKSIYKDAGLSEDQFLDGFPGRCEWSRIYDDLKLRDIAFFDLSKTARKIVTSDNPVVLDCESLGDPNCTVIYPLSPEVVCVIASRGLIGKIQRDNNPKRLASFVNEFIVRFADRYLISCDGLLPVEFVGRHASHSFNP